MGLSLLAPFFLAGLAAVAIPVLVHLADRDRRDVVRFPSLKFLTRLPYRQVRRQRIRHPLLFTLRTLAVVLLVSAFSRPLWNGASTSAGGEADREVVLALDRSYSMAYGDTWARAVEAARRAIAALPPAARVTLMTFDDKAEVRVPSTADRQTLNAAVDGLSPGSRRTRLAPALQMADDVLLDAPAALREVVLISDFQAQAWERAGGSRSSQVRLAPGTRLTPVDVASERRANVMVAGVEARRSGDAARPALSVAVRLVNQGPDAVRGVPVSLTLNGEEKARENVALDPSGSSTLRLGPIELPPDFARLTVRAGADELEVDNAFHQVVSPRGALPVLLVTARDARDDASLYLREALAIAVEPAFEVRSRTVDRVRSEDVEGASVVVLDDSPFPAGAAGRALVGHVAAGGGLWVVLGRRGALESWPQEAAALLPGRWRETVDRLDVRGVSLASVDYDHPVFEIFAGADGGNVSGARFYRYRPIALEEGAAALARYTDGAVALAERRHGDGRVLLSGAPLDNRWSDLPVQPVFVPLLHQVCRLLSGEKTAPPWREVGEAVNLAEATAPGTGGDAAGEAPERVAVRSPSGQVLEIELDGEPSLTLEEAGFYEVELPGRQGSRPLAVNVNRAESDLARLDVEAFVAASTALSDSSPPPAMAALRDVTPEERERRQGVWWYLALAALLLLAAESIGSNRKAARERSSGAGA